MTAAGIYLALGLLLAVCTIGIFVPRLYGPFAVIASFGGLVLAYFIPQFTLLGLIVTGIAFHYGALSVSGGQIGLALHVVSYAVLLYYLLRLGRALPELDGAPVRDGDQPFAADLDAPARAALRPARTTWLPMLTYRIPAMRECRVIRNIVFREVEGVRLRLDVYRPARPGPATGARGAVSEANAGEGSAEPVARPRPALIYIHGGAWLIGTRRQSRFMLYELAAAGYTVFAVSYRFAPRYPLPSAIVDCKAAVAWVRDHAAEHGALGDRIIVLGGSAGGHLAAMVALSPERKEFQPGFESADTSVEAGVILYGVPDFVGAFGERRDRATQVFLERIVFRKRYKEHADLFHAASPVAYLGAHAPSLLLVHGSLDHVVPIHESRRFAERLRTAGARRVHLMEVPLGQHAFEVFPTPLHQRTVRVILRFIESVTRGAE